MSIITRIKNLLTTPPAKQWLKSAYMHYFSMCTIYNRIFGKLDVYMTADAKFFVKRISRILARLRAIESTDIRLIDIDTIYIIIEDIIHLKKTFLEFEESLSGSPVRLRKFTAKIRSMTV